MFTVYVLKNEIGKIYIGQTKDLAKRLLQHNKKSKRGYGKNDGPFSVVHHEVFPTRANAMYREKMLKSGKGREWLRGFLRK